MSASLGTKRLAEFLTLGRWVYYLGLRCTVLRSQSVLAGNSSSVFLTRILLCDVDFFYFLCVYCVFSILYINLVIFPRFVGRLTSHISRSRRSRLQSQSNGFLDVVALGFLCDSDLDFMERFGFLDRVFLFVRMVVGFRVVRAVHTATVGCARDPVLVAFAVFLQALGFLAATASQDHRTGFLVQTKRKVSVSRHSHALPRTKSDASTKSAQTCGRSCKNPVVTAFCCSDAYENARGSFAK